MRRVRIDDNMRMTLFHIDPFPPSPSTALSLSLSLSLSQRPILIFLLHRQHVLYDNQADFQAARPIDLC